MTPETTAVKLAYGRETLVFGLDYVFGVSTPSGRDDAVSGRLESRAANGDLVVLVDSSGTTKRLRPSKILSVAGDGKDRTERLPGETATAYLARIERELGRHYSRWVASDEGQRALEEAAREDAGRRGSSRLDGGEEPNYAAGPMAESEDVAFLNDPGDDTDGVHPAAIAKAKRSAKPYAERNQVWKCGSCKRRTRAAFCENGHPRVEAPAGKRRETR